MNKADNKICIAVIKYIWVMLLSFLLRLPGYFKGKNAGGL
jgi:hypothetical protein